HHPVGGGPQASVAIGLVLDQVLGPVAALEGGSDERAHHRRDRHGDDHLQKREAASRSHGGGFRIGRPKGASVAPGGVFPRFGPKMDPVPVVTPPSWPGASGRAGTPGAPGTSGAPGTPVVLVAERGAPGVPFRSDPWRSETRSVTRSMLSVRVPS